MINEYALKTPQQAVDDLFLFTPPNPTRPLQGTNQTYFPTFNENNSDLTNVGGGLGNEAQWWLDNAKKNPTIQYKLAFWMHILFPINRSIDTHSWMFYDYLELLRFHTNDSIKNLAKRITRDNSMLFYLNNRRNVAVRPDQNYAREFLELFTILKGEQKETGNYTNYTEQDVQQAAKVFTGFTTDGQHFNRLERINAISKLDPITMLPRGFINVSTHDTGNKTFSSAFGNTVISGRNTIDGIEQELDDFISMVFNQPETAKNYCRRLYRYFVSRNITPEIEADIIKPLSNTMLSNNYNIVPVVKQLLCSKHFYDEDDTISGDEIIGGLAKSYIELFLQMLNIFEVPYPDYATNSSTLNGFFANKIISESNKVSFSIFSPNTVEGYTGYSNAPDYDKTWITTGTLRIRFLTTIDPLIDNQFGTIRLFTASFIRNSGHFSNPANADILMEELYDLLFVATPQGARHTYFKNELLGNLSSINWKNEWDNFIKTNNANSVTIALNRVIRALVKSPEYQVM